MPDSSPPTADNSASRGGFGRLLKSSALVSAVTMLSRFLGLARDILVASMFDAGKTDAFLVAFKIPNFFRRLFAEGAFAVAFVPVLSECKTQQSHAMVQQLVNHIAGSLGLVLLIVTGLATLMAPLLAFVFAPGFTAVPEKLALTSELLRIIFPYLFLISMTAFAGSVLNTYQKFLIPAATPVLLNVCLIGTTLFLTPYLSEPIFALAWGVLFAGIAQLLLQLPFLAQLRLLPNPRLGFSHPGVRKILKLMLPVLFGVSVSQINLLFDTLLASFLREGSVSWLYYSDRINGLPLGVFGVAIASVILPNLSQTHAEKDPQHFAAMLDWGVRAVLLIGVPAAAALLVITEPVVISLFYRGAMDELGVQMISASLRAYALGLVAFMLIKVLASGYFSRQDSKTPIKIGIQAMLANMLFNLALVFWLDHVGLALATSLAAFLNMGLLLHGLWRQGIYQAQPGWWRMLLQLVGANTLMVLGLYYLQGDWQYWLGYSDLQRVFYISGLVFAGLAFYWLSLMLLGFRVKHFLRKV